MDEKKPTLTTEFNRGEARYYLLERISGRITDAAIMADTRPHPSTLHRYAALLDRLFVTIPPQIFDPETHKRLSARLVALKRARPSRSGFPACLEELRDIEIELTETQQRVGMLIPAFRRMSAEQKIKNAYLGGGKK